MDQKRLSVETPPLDYGKTVPWVRNPTGKLVAIAGADGLPLATRVKATIVFI